jgi:hypothetical protein
MIVHKKVTAYKMFLFLFSLQLLSETFRILRRTERDMIINIYWSPCEVSVTVPDFNEIMNFSTGFRKIPKRHISLKSVHWESSRSMWAGGRTDMTKLIDAWRNIANASKNKRVRTITYLFMVCLTTQSTARIA